MDLKFTILGPKPNATQTECKNLEKDDLISPEIDDAHLTHGVVNPIANP